jgi:hypothetical protein
VFADFTIVRDFIEEKQLLGGFRRLYPKRKLIPVYAPVLGNLQYEDLVLAAWLAKTRAARLSVIQSHINSYATAISRIRGAAGVSDELVQVSSPRQHSRENTSHRRRGTSISDSRVTSEDFITKSPDVSAYEQLPVQDDQSNESLRQH